MAAQKQTGRREAIENMSDILKVIPIVVVLSLTPPLHAERLSLALPLLRVATTAQQGSQHDFTKSDICKFARGH